MDEIEERSKDFRDSSNEIQENGISSAKRDSVLDKTITSYSSDGQE